ncbi:MAG: NUDIX domain-containing protein [Bacteroidota bacterium]
MNPPPSIWLAVDAVVFGYSPKQDILVLLIQRKYPPFQDKWALPGGFIGDSESLEEAVSRELEEETGVKVQYLEQLYTFGKPDRDPRRRVISVAYYALVRPDAFELNPQTDASDAQWFSLNELPELAFDHPSILRQAINRLRSKITYEPIGFELLDESFTFAELFHLYKSILGPVIDQEKGIEKRNFKKKFLRLGLLEELGEKRKHAGSGRPAQLYRFNQKRYQELLEEGGAFMSIWIPSTPRG